MAVTVLWKGRWYKVETSPGTKLLQVLDQVCARLGLQPLAFTLQYNSKQLDLSLPFRLAQISNNAKLELVALDRARSAVATTLVLQLDNGTRVKQPCTSLTPLWTVLRTAEARSDWPGEPITRRYSSRDGQDCYDKPVLLIGGQRYGVDSEELARVTVEEAGVTSSGAVARLAFIQSDVLRTDTEDYLKNIDQLAEALQSDLQDSIRQANEQAAAVSRPQPITLHQNSGENLKATNQEVSPSLQQRSTIDTPNPNPVEEKRKRDQGEKSSHATGAISQASTSELMDWERDRMTGNTTANQPRGPLTMGDVLGVSLEPEPMSLDEARPLRNFKFPDPKPEGKTGDLQAFSPEGRHEQGPAVAVALPDIVDRQTAVFGLDETVTETTELPEGFYDVTVDDVKVMMRQLTASRKALEERPLAFQSVAKAKVHEGQAKLTTVRIHFPDRLVLQGNFKANEAVASVYGFVRQHCSLNGDEFTLSTAFPRRALKDSPTTTMQQAGLVPSTVVYFKPANQSTGPYLQADSIAQFTATFAVAQERAAHQADQSTTDSSGQRRHQPRSLPTDSRHGDVPKWLKLSKH